MRLLAAEHPFVDGNKRTALVTADVASPRSVENAMPTSTRASRGSKALVKIPHRTDEKRTCEPVGFADHEDQPDGEALSDREYRLPADAGNQRRSRAMIRISTGPIVAGRRPARIVRARRLHSLGAPTHQHGGDR